MAKERLGRSLSRLLDANGAYVVMLALLLVLSVCDEGKADVLYGLTNDGRVGQIDTGTSAWTAVRTVPAWNQLGLYTGFTVYQGTFMASWTAQDGFDSHNSVPGDFVAFGTVADDFCLLGHVPSITGYACPTPSVRPTSGTLNGLTFNGSTEYLMQFDLTSPKCTIPANAALVPNSSFSGCWEQNGVGGAAFRDQNTFYAFRSCSTGSVPDGTYHTTIYFTRWTYANNTWTEDRDIQVNFSPGAMAVNPANLNEIFVTGGSSYPFTTTEFRKLTYDGTTLTVTPLTAINTYPVGGLAYGPSQSSIISPLGNSGIKCHDRAWSTLSSMFYY